ncbi:MAG: sugar ABC transporter ATP-binding protein [Chloroflexi bacterium]|uniref:ATP-binding cassette domain-containing protein n=1 Tax=Candidatus Chlorohelix allophototropha TaxID=3003348 RepID=A0A8T7LY80_9CHLR|nr:sugar ABC transporter ATP-binding protein [Chloroflexota bacterium]WJW66175.1 ATP-binding cassette domain-containing protein [Chloroflexota bacterium L227-S17]
MTAEAQPILKLVNVSKRFGGLTAVDQVSLEIFPGEVVGLLGDNGAGKSTLIKMISGVYRPDGGQIIYQGKEVHFSTPLEARRQGIETIYQDLALCENLDATDNIFLGREPIKHTLGIFNRVDRNYMLRESKQVLDQLDIIIPNLKRPIRQMSGGQRQAVSIARAVYWNAKLMIMDEPTAALGVPEQRKVLELVHTLRQRGVPVIVISHNMQDVFAVADRMVVMRRGTKAGERSVTNTNPNEIVSLMVGAE